MRTWALRPDGDPTPHALGGRLCLAVVNSVLWRRSAEPTELLADFAALVDYLAQVGVLTDDGRTALEVSARRRPELATRVHEDAVRLREALYRITSAAAAGEPPASADLAILNGHLQQGMARVQLGSTADGKVRPEWTGPEAEVAWPLW